MARFPKLLETESAWRVPGGCAECRGSGYRGRVGIYEFVEVTGAVQEAVMRQAAAVDLVAAASGRGYRTLREDGLIKAWRGVTSVEEVLRVTGINEGAE